MPAPGKTKLIKFPPSQAGKDVKCPGYKEYEERTYTVEESEGKRGPSCSGPSCNGLVVQGLVVQGNVLKK